MLYSYRDRSAAGGSGGMPTFKDTGISLIINQSMPGPQHNGPPSQWGSSTYLILYVCSSAPDCYPINRVKNALERTVSLDEICLKIVWLDRHTVDEDMRHWT
jgi:hypothetical protein